MCWLPILQLGSRTLNAASAAVGSVKLFPCHPLLYPKSYSDLSKAIFFTTSWDSLSVYFFPPHFKHLRGSSSSLTQVNTTAATVKWEDHPELPSLGDAGHLSSWNLTELSAIPTCLRHSSVQSMAVQQFKWRNTLPQLGKTQQKKTKVRGGKKKPTGSFYYPFSWVLYYSPPSRKWFWNSHKHIKKTEAYKRSCPGGTKQNWVRKLGNIGLAQANTIRQKMKFWLECGHAGSKQLSPTLTSVLMPWATAVYHVPHFEEDMFSFILHIVHPQCPLSTQQQRRKNVHNLFLSLTKNHLVLVNRSKSRDDKMSSKSRHLTFLPRNTWVHLPRYCHSCDTVNWVQMEPQAPAPLHLDQSILNTTSILIENDFWNS